MLKGEGGEHLESVNTVTVTCPSFVRTTTDPKPRGNTPGLKLEAAMQEQNLSRSEMARQMRTSLT